MTPVQLNQLKYWNISSPTEWHNRCRSAVNVRPAPRRLQTLWPPTSKHVTMGSGSEQLLNGSGLGSPKWQLSWVTPVLPFDSTFGTENYRVGAQIIQRTHNTHVVPRSGNYQAHVKAKALKHKIILISSRYVYTPLRELKGTDWRGRKSWGELEREQGRVFKWP